MTVLLTTCSNDYQNNAFLFNHCEFKFLQFIYIVEVSYNLNKFKKGWET